MFKCLLCAFTCKTRSRIRHHVTEIHNTGVGKIQARRVVEISAKRGYPLSSYYKRIDKKMRVFFNKCLCSPCRRKDICPYYKPISHEQRDVITHLKGIPEKIKMIMWVVECPYRVTDDDYKECKSNGGKNCEGV